MLTKVLVAVCILFIGRLLMRRRQPPLPPGPRGWPLIGNITDFPTSCEWEVFTKWGEKWGDLLSVSVFGTTFVVINSYERCQEMLEKKSNVYSDRPYIPMATELSEMRDLMGLLPYDNRLKSYRRLFHQELGSSSGVREFFPQEERLLDHCFQHSGATILRIAYGYEVEESNDPFVNIANTAMDHFNRATTPGSFLVNRLPILLKIPDWFPGTGWKRIGREWAKDYWTMMDEPFNFVKKQLSEGTADDSFTAKWLKKKISPQEELDLKFSSGSMFAGGSETTAVTFCVFFLVMAMFPEVQNRAQAELNSVVGQDRLPSFEDRDRLPYVEAVCKEVMRYHAVAPNGVPHCTVREDVHDGMFIPKGAIIFSNIWSMTHDPKVYKKPMEFNPGRFLGDAPEQDPKEIVFGFGRRVCPGRLLADASIFITLAMSLAAFKVTPCDGEEPLSLKSKPGIISHIHPFRCRIVPNMEKEKLLALIRC
ncbi:cytochrome P450 [Gymnopus androsaceus JB14]|uniref:Cytochrome P450 n=1 Tax=Gymnopus androsaceus JB14 TaxID=1447944 RepID=A0A6A4HPT3_9AGAR|nr:cytochrome P450 [Gymnopus androsaceus JB14]